MPATQAPESSLKDKVVHSALWMIATRWVHRLLGLISTMVLARVLMPEDFGVVAAVTAVVAIMDGFFEFGFDLALIREKDATRDDFDTAWTMRLLKGILFGLALIAASPLVAHYADEGDIVAISALIGAGLMIRGAENVGMVQFQKELQFDRLFRIKLYPRILGVITSIAVALWLRSYWAIVIGAVMLNVYQTLFSYLMCPFRPRLRLEGAGKLWRFSKWIVISAISRQLFAATDRFALSGWISKEQLGFFSVGGSLASMITNELVGAVGTALIPGYAKLQDEQSRLRAAFLASQSAFIALLVPAAVGVFVLSRPLTQVVLGAQWTDAAPILGLFGLFYLCYSIVENLNRFMAMTGLQVISARSGIVRSTVFLLAIYPAFEIGGIAGLIGTKITLSAVEILFLSYHCTRRIDTPMSRYLGTYVRPLLASAAMAAATLPLVGMLHTPPVVTLFACAGVGAVIYGTCSLAIWRVSGRPNGLEAIVIDLLARKGLLPGR
ncbi:oligosaccharide flippase family protein [Nitrogeniibacter mangrovi]|uniref:Oligosaccharide flippase family protein n=1 Tax=Nitrogeniibacter mangrovi TaxID=2016596 RepID=A0A6C1B514_9RHOO|nr:oligosaccharide flippase family protein [Nitrogeniibacter mangrovi]QID18523.1 oligosaccharide flippase family protein [Nitrogeniibacter mangrovi]